jgi:hypothetical protein
MNTYPVAGVVQLNRFHGAPRNSNTFVDDVIEESGGQIQNFEKAYLQNSWESYQDKFKTTYERRGMKDTEINEFIRKMRGFDEKPVKEGDL